MEGGRVGGWEVNQGPPGPESAAKESWSPIATVQNGRNTNYKDTGEEKKTRIFFYFCFFSLPKET